MCGIIAIVRRPSTRTAPDPSEVRTILSEARHEASRALTETGLPVLERIADLVGQVDGLLSGPPGVTTLMATPGLAEDVVSEVSEIERSIIGLESALDTGAVGSGEDVEAFNAAIIRAKDAVWAVRADRVRTARAVADLAGAEPSGAATEAFTSMQQALSALDRLEVRGRDSAGLYVLVSGHGLPVSTPPLSTRIAERTDPLFKSEAVTTAEGHLGFVYKAAAEVGELGDNTAALRAAIRDDQLLHQALEAPGARALVLGHTRWASVGIISEPNAHPLNSEESGRSGPPGVVAVLNGDVDNFADLCGAEDLDITDEITTDAKVIPTLTSRRIEEGLDLTEAFRRTAVALEGSVAVAASVAAHPDRLALALRGSGQALYVGLAEDAFVVASEPYGVVEETSTYLRMDGERPANAENPTGSRGQIVLLDAAGAGALSGVGRIAYDGTPLPVEAGELSKAEITTRDIDRAEYPHFLLKEISEAPISFRKTLRGKLHDLDGALSVVFGEDALPTRVREGLGSGRITSILVIGQGTAHIAGMSLVAVLGDLVPSGVRVEALPATELSGFRLRSDMSDVLVVAISQSGTTTDTNRTVDLVRSRGAAVIAIVNRRGSDLTDKADGVIYTSDGRDVEMSVASTKAFYAQVAAGCLLGVALLDEIGVPIPDRYALLEGLRDLPEAMERTLSLRPALAAAARTAASRRYWAVVGNGPNVVAAREVRIKLSELCYKSIACDTTEDKKHIDLSSEPLILVCAAGLSGSNADDVAKEVAIYRAHKAAPVVIASEGEERFSAALHAVQVPPVHPRLAFVLSAMAGHLFGYEAALAIDSQALPLRQARGAIESAVLGDRPLPEMLEELEEAFLPVAGRFFDGLRTGEYNGHLEATTAVRLSSLFRYALGQIPLDSYQVEYGKVGTPGVVLEDLTASLTTGIEELTRPIDAIKHQAKTVTVGISRADESFLQVALVQEVLAAGAARDQLSYESLRALADIDPVVEEVLGYTRYRIEGDVEDGSATAVVVDQGGIARGLPSRVGRNPELRGTKRRVAAERRLLVAKGRSDGRPILIVPEEKAKQATGMTLLHLRFVERAPLATIRGALQGYRNRYSALRDVVCETEPTFREDLLCDLPPVDLLADSIYELADHWRS